MTLNKALAKNQVENQPGTDRHSLTLRGFVAHLRGMPLGVALAGWIVVSACSSGIEPNLPSQSEFVESYVALRMAAVASPSGVITTAERDSILEEQGVSAEELLAFAEVYGGDAAFMQQVWLEVEDRMEVLRQEGSPPD